LCALKRQFAELLLKLCGSNSTKELLTTMLTLSAALKDLHEKGYCYSRWRSVC
jgi:hypothetical protein